MQEIHTHTKSVAGKSFPKVMAFFFLLFFAEFLCETEGCQVGKKHIRTSADMDFPALFDNFLKILNLMVFLCFFMLN